MFGAMKQMQYDSGLQNWFFDNGDSWGGGPIRVSALDSANNLYVSGLYSTVTADSTFVVKMNSQGIVQWARFYGRPGFNLSGPNEITGMVTDSDFLWAVSENSNATNGYNGLHLLKISLSDGSLLQDYYWDTSGPSLSLTPQGITISNNNLIISNGASNANYRGLLSLSKAGTVNWTSRISAAAPATQPSADSSNNIYVAGSRTVSSNVVVQVTKINSSGTAQWDKYINGYSSTLSDLTVNDLKVSADNYIYVLLTNRNWWGDTASTNGNLIKLDSTGAIVWQVTLKRPTNFTFAPGDLAIDNLGNIYVSGIGSDNPLTVFLGVVYKFNSSGALQWTRQFQNFTADAITRAAPVAIQVGTNDAMFVSLTTESGAGEWSQFSLPLDGSDTGTYNVGNANVTYGSSTATSQTSNLFLVSTTTSSDTYIGTSFANVTTTTANTTTATGTIQYIN